MARGNRKPVQTSEFLDKRFSAPDLPEGTTLGAVIGIRLPLEVDQAVRALPNKSEWLRKVICDAARAELMVVGDRPGDTP